MIKVIICDFSRVLLFPKDISYTGSLNELHRKLSQSNHYNPLDHFKLNTELLHFFVSCSEKVELHIFTSDVIQDAPEFEKYLNPIFVQVHSASKMGVSKNEIEAYRSIISKLHLKPNEILYIDDNPTYLQTANDAGLVTIAFTTNEDLFKKIQKLLSTEL